MYRQAQSCYATDTRPQEPRGILTRTRERSGSLPEQDTETRKALMAALAKATAKGGSCQSCRKTPDNDENPYYTLTTDQIEALVNGNIEAIESWVSNLDRVQATWLFRGLAKQDC